MENLKDIVIEVLEALAKVVLYFLVPVGLIWWAAGHHTGWKLTTEVFTALIGAAWIYTAMFIKWGPKEDEL